MRSEVLAAFGPADSDAYDYLVGWIRQNDFASRALKEGTSAPDFFLPDANGRLVSSKEIAATRTARRQLLSRWLVPILHNGALWNSRNFMLGWSIRNHRIQ